MTVLYAAIAAISTPVIGAQPTLCFGDDPLNPADVAEFTSQDTNRIQGNIAKVLARMAPYVDVLGGGTLPSGVSETVRAVVQERAVLNQSLVRPQFTADTAMCGEVGEAAEVGDTEYSYFLATNRGMGPLVCVKGMRNEFEGSYLAAEDALQKQIVQLVNADVRATLVDRSGCKVICRSGKQFTDVFNGDTSAIDMNWPYAQSGLPDSPVTFAFLEYLNTFLRENFLVEPFEEKGGESVLRFMGSQEIINKLRDEAGVKSNYQYIAAGSYDLGKNQLIRYRWEGPYRGYALGVDPQPLRFSEVNPTTGAPVFIEPEKRTKVTKGYGGRVNPAWARAKFEVALVIGANSFDRLTPAQYTGEGSWKFPAQVSMGELKFKVIEDNSDNVWGDYGRFFYQIMRAYRPKRPHHVCAIAYSRAQADFNFSPVTQYFDYSSTDSL